MIDVAVMSLICANRDDDVAQSSVGREVPILDRDLRGRDVFVCAIVRAQI